MIKAQNTVDSVDPRPVLQPAMSRGSWRSMQASHLIRAWARRALLALMAIVILSWMDPSLAQSSGVASTTVTGGTSGQPFVIQQDDYFVNKLLKGLLGDTLNVNSSTADQTFSGPGTLGTVFRVFNLGVAFFGSLMILFVAVVGILNSGHDGEFLGKRWSSFWVPVRFAGGAALMLPITNSGYSFVQAMCIWIAGQGVGFADSIWNAILDNHAPPTPAKVVAVVPTTKIVASILVNQTCNEYLRPLLDNSKSPRYVSDSFSLGNENREWLGAWVTQDVYHAGNEWKQPDQHLCGRVSYRFNNSWQDPYTPLRKGIADVHEQQVLRALRASLPIAQKVAKALHEEDSAALRNVSAEFQSFIATQSKIYSDALTNVVEAQLVDTNQDRTRNFHEDLKRYGFAVAGAYYIELTKSANAVREGLSAVPNVDGPNVIMINALQVQSWPIAEGYIRTLLDGQSVFEKVSGSGTSNSPQGLASGRSATIDIDESMFSNLDKSNFFQDFSHKLSMGILDIVIAVGSNNNSGSAGGDNNNLLLSDLWNNSDSTNHSVISQLKNKGDTILNIASVVYAAHLFATGTAEAANDFSKGMVPPISLLAAILRGAITMVFTLVLSLVTLGIVLAVVIPMTPFMIWTMGLAGLLVLVIESLVASMLWAVMIMHPSGEGMTSDQSRTGLMILLMLFFRPALMLMGMAAGIFMVDPMVDYVNDMFYFVFRSTQRDTMTFLFITFGICSVYVTLVLAIVRKSFALIHLVPDRVMRWIGGTHETLGESEVADRGDNLAGGVGQRISNLGHAMQHAKSGNDGSGRPQKSGMASSVDVLANKIGKLGKMKSAPKS